MVIWEDYYHTLYKEKRERERERERVEQPKIEK